MRKHEPVVFRTTWKCDVCGFEEFIENRTPDSGGVADEQRPVRSWTILRSLAFSFGPAGGIDVCSRECADKHVADFLDSEFRR